MLVQSIRTSLRHAAQERAFRPSLPCPRCMHRMVTKCYNFGAAGNLALLSAGPRILYNANALRQQPPRQVAQIRTTPAYKASAVSADTIMENLNDLYATAKDEFEIAAEETEKKTVYAADDREAAREALTLLKEALARAVAESDPEVAKEVQGRVGARIRELENAVVAMEESALED